MNKNSDILKRIISDLKIRRYDDEVKAQYIARVVYSALAMWIRYSTLDEDIFQQSSELVGVSKIHVLNKCKPFLDNMIEIYPEIYEWFYPEKCEENPIGIVRDRLYNGGELVDVGFNTDLALPSYRECGINNGVRIIRGINSYEFQRTTGIAQFKAVNEKDRVDIEKILNFYGFKNKSAQEILNEHIKNIKWSKKEKITVDIFDKYSKESFSNCWNREYKLKDNDISLYKYEFFDFGFVRKLHGNIYTSQIDEYLIEQFEVRRFMYGLKNEVDNSVLARYKKYSDKNLVRLKLCCDLPQKELNILLLLGWPLKNINDRLNLLFHASSWLFVEAVLKNLNIELQEVN